MNTTERAPSIGQMMKRVIEHTANPFSAIVLQEAAGSVDKLGKLMAEKAVLDDVSGMTKRLFKDFSDEELKSVSSREAFIMALAGALKEALIMYIRRIAGDPSVR